MKAILTILASCLLSACASQQFHTVTVSGDGDYYIAESGSGRYYDPESTGLTSIGMYPWWSLGQFNSGFGGYPAEFGGNPFWGFFHYSPYFYPHYFSVWYPPVYRDYYGWYGGNYPYWCPPYRVRRHHAPLGIGGGASGIAGDAPPVPGDAGSVTANPDLRWAIGRVLEDREHMNSRRPGLQPQAAAQHYQYPGVAPSVLARDSGIAELKRGDGGTERARVAALRSKSSESFNRSPMQATIRRPAAAPTVIQRSRAVSDRPGSSRERPHN